MQKTISLTVFVHPRLHLQTCASYYFLVELLLQAPMRACCYFDRFVVDAAGMRIDSVGTPLNYGWRDRRGRR